MTANVALAIVAGVLVGCGVYLLIARGIVRAFLGVLLIGNGINMLFLVASGPPGRAPIVGPNATDQADMSDPLPQAMVLTAIVITVALTGYVMALAYRAWSLTASDQMLDDTEDARLHDRVDEQGEESSVDTITEPAADDDVPPAHDGDAGIRTGSSAAPTQAEGRS